MSGHVAVIGAGSWGTAMAGVLTDVTATVLWARRVERADEIARSRTNPEYTGAASVPASLEVTSDLRRAVVGAEVVAMAVPALAMAEVAAAVRADLDPDVPVVSLAKGLDPGTGQRMSEVLATTVPGHPIAVLTGPNLAGEILAGQPAAGVIAAVTDTVAVALRDRLSTPVLRLYSHSDVVGCEVAGVVKNVIAIAVGMAEGMGFGANTRATLITRGLAEMSRLGAVLGADPLTFAGLAGVGDLTATCLSPRSRNHAVGHALGQGRALGEILGSMTMIAEGVRSAPGVLDLAHRYGVDMPITEQVVAVCRDGRLVTEALEALMGREHRSEREVSTSRPIRRGVR